MVVFVIVVLRGVILRNKSKTLRWMPKINATITIPLVHERQQFPTLGVVRSDPPGLACRTETKSLSLALLCRRPNIKGKENNEYSYSTKFGSLLKISLHIFID